MRNEALVIIDIQNDITKNYKEIIDNINKAVDWAESRGVHVIYFRHENITPGAKLFKPGTRGSELAADLKVVSKNIFTKYKSNVLTCADFAAFIEENKINTFYLAGADAGICVKSSCLNLCKANYTVTVLQNCIASRDKKQIPELLEYYKKQGGNVAEIEDIYE